MHRRQTQYDFLILLAQPTTIYCSYVLVLTKWHGKGKAGVGFPSISRLL